MTAEPDKTSGMPTNRDGPVRQDQGDHFRENDPRRSNPSEAASEDQSATNTTDEDEGHEGGASVDKASGGGRNPAPERTRDHDPDGDRSGLGET